jgi:hypothetical protein
MREQGVCHDSLCVKKKTMKRTDYTTEGVVFTSKYGVP